VVYCVWARVIVVDGREEQIPCPPARDSQRGAEEGDPGFVMELENPGTLISSCHPDVGCREDIVDEEGCGKEDETYSNLTLIKTTQTENAKSPIANKL
jgi:hypothetical protein